jgi:two-component system LytT family sensor kinase
MPFGSQTALAFFLASTGVVGTLESQQQSLVTLVVRVGAAAAIASILVRFELFKRLLFRPRRSPAESLQLAAFFGLMFGAAIAVRVLLGFKAPDLGVEGALLAGVLGGYLAGAVAGGLMSLPALLKGELLAPLVLVLAGVAGATARRLAPSAGDIWNFSPFVDMNIYRWYQRRFGKPRGDWQMMFFLLVVLCQIGCLLLGRLVHGPLLYLHSNGVPVVPGLFFYLDSTSNGVKFAIVVTSIACVSIPLKIWNSVRNQVIVEEQQRLLTEARLAALTSQINPHFLFNTLNSISSLIRLDPEQARTMVQKLSSILRRLLRRQESFCPLSEELSFIDDYLNIEVVRFGGDKLRIVKDIDPATLELPVPSMILQPLVENCVKHGLRPKLAGGVIRIGSRRQGARLHIAVEDDGEGTSEEWRSPSGCAPAPADGSAGVGLSNVRERLKVLYGADFSFRITSEPGRGTRVEIELPTEVETPLPPQRYQIQVVG